MNKCCICTCVPTDVNECEANPCSQECSNVYGSYQCYCRRGYQLSDMDGITCEGTIVGLHGLPLLNCNRSALTFTLCCSQTSMSALCQLVVMCAPTAAPTPREVFIVRAHPQATPWPPMDAHAKVS